MPIVMGTSMRSLWSIINFKAGNQRKYSKKENCWSKNSELPSFQASEPPSLLPYLRIHWRRKWGLFQPQIATSLSSYFTIEYTCVFLTFSFFWNIWNFTWKFQITWLQFLFLMSNAKILHTPEPIFLWKLYYNYQKNIA